MNTKKPKTNCKHCENKHEHSHGHNHQHEHTHEGNLTFQLLRIIVAAVITVLAFIFKASNSNISLILFAAACLICGADVFFEAIANIFHGEIFDENFLMSIASIGAFAIGKYSEGTAVMLLFQIGELFQSYAVGKSRKSISRLMDIRPDHANVFDGNSFQAVNPETVQIGDIIEIRAGEKIPLDCVITDGFTTVDTSPLTGEALPREYKAGDEMQSGCINLSGVIKAKVTKEYSDSTVSKILELTENAAHNKSKSESFISKFAKIYTPAVVIAALLLALLPPLILGQDFSIWIYRALSFLVISCPCALVISVPLSFFGGIGAASKSGILIKGSGFVEAISKAELAVFDKTGTLTEGKLQIEEIHPVNISEKELLTIAAHLEYSSTHPIAKSIVQGHSKRIDESKIGNINEKAGFGIVGEFDGTEYYLGNEKMLAEMGLSPIEATNRTTIHLARKNEYLGCIVLSDKVKKDSKDAVSALRRLGINETVMLTGDNEISAKKIADEVGIDKVHASLLPQDKVSLIEKYEKSVSKGKTLLYVGDGINDAPALALADIGISLGSLGSDSAIEAADVVIMTDSISKIAKAIELSRRTVKIAKENIIFALAVKFVILILGALGVVGMWAAVFADVGVSFLAIINAMRALISRRKQ